MGIRLSTHALPLSRSPAAKRDRYVRTLVVPRRALPSPRRGGALQAPSRLSAPGVPSGRPQRCLHRLFRGAQDPPRRSLGFLPALGPRWPRGLGAQAPSPQAPPRSLAKRRSSPAGS